uniref:Integrin alpha FG-GAP repeat containing 1 n=1 Tax=Cyprinus carpio TaxID=7962 RepID=A0A8C2DP96_CYPCA
MLLSWAWFLTLSLGFVGQHVTFALQDVTGDLFGQENSGTVAAFGDFNSDKQTDIFIIRKHSELVIFLADLKAPYFKPKVHLTKEAFPSDFNITGVVPGDYDGDSQMDVLITGYQKELPGEKVFIFWGRNQTLGKVLKIKQRNRRKCFLYITLAPLVFGFSACVKKTSAECTKHAVLLFVRQLKCEQALNLEVKMRVPHSNAFIDLNKDFTADALVYHRPHFTSSLTHSPSFCFSSDGDGSQDHLLPVCMDSGCERSAIFLDKPGGTEWVPVLTDFRRKDSVWGFVSSSDVPITLHLGDYNMDGFPDALVILRNTSSSTQQQAFLLENVPCNNASCRQAGRMFRVHWEQSDLSAIPKAVVATFFDIYEDGILDMIVLSKVEGKDELVIHALKNNFEADAYFVKVIVLSGLCSNDCPENVKPFGVNQPGPYVMYTSVDSNGYLKNSSAGQLSQSAHLALQLPYTVLGLGRSANFLDHLFVGIPRPPGGKDVRKQEWTAIIPNSQLIVIPYPQNDPHSWSARLYLTPSNIVLLTAIALIGVCVFILVIIGILHWQEKVRTNISSFYFQPLSLL